MSKKVKKRETFGIRLTALELTHLRDLFSVMLPPQMNATVSQKLASLEHRPMIEARLWEKVVKKCEAAGIPMGDEAPDYVVGVASTPEMGVFALAENESEYESGREPYAPDEDEEDNEG